MMRFFCLVLLCFIIVFFIIYYIVWNKLSNRTPRLALTMKIIGLPGIGVSLAFLTYALKINMLMSEGLYVKDIKKGYIENDSPLSILIDKEFIPDSIITGLEEKYDFSELNNFDKIIFKEESKPETILDCLYITINYSDNFVENSVVLENTGILFVNGSDLALVADVHKVYLPKGGYTYKESSYLRHNDIFYAINSELEIDDTKTYMIEYNLSEEGSISDLTGSYKTYLDCIFYID